MHSIPLQHIKSPWGSTVIPPSPAERGRRQNTGPDSTNRLGSQGWAQGGLASCDGQHGSQTAGLAPRVNPRLPQQVGGLLQGDGGRAEITYRMMGQVK